MKRQNRLKGANMLKLLPLRKMLSATAIVFSTGLMVSTISQPSIAVIDKNTQVVSTTDRAMTIEVSEGKLIRLSRPAEHIFVANPAVADIQVKSPQLIYVFGKKRGGTTLFALDANDKPIYSANINVITSLSTLDGSLKSLLPDARLTASMVGNMIVLQGIVATPEQAETAERLAKSLTGVTDVMNKIEIIQPTQVNIRVRFAEISRTVMKDVGIKWDNLLSSGGDGLGFASNGGPIFSSSINATGGVTKTFNLPTDSHSLFGGFGLGNLDLNFIIDALQDEGFVSVLAEPNITVLSGEKANFLAGGEFPVPVPQGDNGITIDFKDFGVNLDVEPTVLNSGRINLKIRPEVSDITDAGSVSISGFRIPAITTRQVETTVELGSGQSFAIAGLLQNRISRSSDKVPGLGDLPILGALFRSQSFQNAETELLVVVTPYLVRPISNRKILLPTDSYVAPSDAEIFLKGYEWKPQRIARDKDGGIAKGPSLRGRAGFQLD